jgi:hypothetical protein
MVETRKYHSPKDYLDAAKSSETSLEELSFLATSEYDFVRLAVVANASVTSAILRIALPAKLDTWNSQNIASGIGCNAKTPRDTMKQIAERLKPYLKDGRGNEMAARAALSFCNNPSAPLEILMLVAGSRETAVGIRKKIASNSLRRDVVEAMRLDISEAVRKRAENRLRSLK